MTDGVYVTRFTPAAQRQMRAVPLPEARRILIRLGEFQRAMDKGDTSAFDIKPLTGQDGMSRLRVGHCRVVYTVDNGALVVWVVAVGDRRDVYRAL
ncbi:type II toxin-antitoxin system RelE/ParE family toxin [Streptomyces sp. WMMC500]|uniref:type II toxin-antitoxin system RelE family toxin n=1 Tax=Streptomyces sp. WMMC500 TaxID=3015154 RepID=UPI00248B449B|nr:type II toxin-antitoxin system RelE/ParE family toxin [Streptomyces sp. WMMC500]WBB57673.1 type II toxin-antitoxin system RelE/ParE family toxin [Streptomyces sp. WMMC500]